MKTRNLDFAWEVLEKSFVMDLENVLVRIYASFFLGFGVGGPTKKILFELELFLVGLKRL